MREQFIFDSIIGAVPQWYQSNSNRHSRTISINGTSFTFCSHRNLTPDLNPLLEFCRNNIPRWFSNLPAILTGTYRLQITQEIALEWLRINNPRINWYKFLAYAEDLIFRTYENIPVTVNLVISDGTGTHDITSPTIQKFIDPLASSPQTYLRVDSELNYIDFQQITWDDIQETGNYKFNPEFLQPFACTLQPHEISFHVTSKGDILIMNSLGLLASCRKRKWHIYDVQTLKNCIGDIASEYWIGCNIFEILLDLSYKRHGALLVYDPNHTVVRNVVNRESLLLAEPDHLDASRFMLRNAVSGISMIDINMASRKKRLLLELASMDGAVVFDNTNILAFGAMIQTHQNAGGQAGARTTAFVSSYLYGGKPFKVSSDGDITIKFNDNGSPHLLNFL